jgi:hypothetical protein
VASTFLVLRSNPLLLASEPMWQMSPTETTIFLSSLVLLLAILLLA